MKNYCVIVNKKWEIFREVKGKKILECLKNFHQTNKLGFVDKKNV